MAVHFVAVTPNNTQRGDYPRFRLGLIITSSDIQKEQKAQIECLYPILDVKDISKSLAYYIKTLGFKEDWTAGTLAQVSRENYGIMLNRSSQVHPQEIWIGVERLEPFYEEYLKSGAMIHQAPTNHSWAYDMKIKDPDGHLLWIGSGPKSDEPYED